MVKRGKDPKKLTAILEILSGGRTTEAKYQDLILTATRTELTPISAGKPIPKRGQLGNFDRQLLVTRNSLSNQQ